MDGLNRASADIVARLVIKDQCLADGTGQFDRMEDINRMAIGDHIHRPVRPPGAGGAPVRGSAPGEFVVRVRQRLRSRLVRVTDERAAADCGR